MQIWKTLKLFISSTFLDLELERDQLAQIFTRLQKNLHSRNLSLIPYDLRWRDRHPDEPIARWCISMLRQCNYFVGILGARYGWRPLEDAEGKENTSRISITEMEVRYALAHIPKRHRFFCFHKDTYFAQKETPEDLSAIAALKLRLQQDGETIYFYGDTQELSENIGRHFTSMVDEEYPPGQKAALQEYSLEQSREEILQQKSLKFVGRKRFLASIHDFVQNDLDHRYLVIHANAGTGKSALLAQFIRYWNADLASIPVIFHFMSMGGNSRELHGVMLNLADQLQKCGVISSPLSPDIARVRYQVTHALEQTRQKLIVVVDGLDEIEAVAQDLTWLPRHPSSSVKIILSTRPVATWHKLQTYPNLCNLELLPLEKQEIWEIIGQYEQEFGLSLSPLDRETLLQRSAGNPLYLKVALEELSTGAVAVGELAMSVANLFEQILERLGKSYGEQAILDYLGLIVASRVGLTEAELREILLSGQERTQITQAQTQGQSQAKQGQSRSTQITDDLIVSINKSLDNFLTIQGGLWRFFHPEFERSIRERLGKAGMRKYHRCLATYFASKGFDYQRSLFEICYQMQWAQEYTQVLELLSNLVFIETKCKASMVDELLEDFARALHNTEVPLPTQLEMNHPSGIAIDRGILALLEKAMRLELQFLYRHPQCVFQTLWNRCYWHDAPESLAHYETEHGAKQTLASSDASNSQKIYKLVEYWREEKEKQVLVWVKSLRPLEPALDSPLKNLLHRHERVVNVIAVSPDGTIAASGSSDTTVCLWNLATGDCIKTLRGHTKDIFAVAFSPDGKSLASGAGDWEIRIWDVETGDCVKILKGHKEEVRSVRYGHRGEKLLSAAKDRTFKIWDTTNGKCVFSSKGLPDYLFSAVFTQDESNIITACRDGIIRIHDAKTGEILGTLAGHTGSTMTIALSEDNQTLVSASDDKTVRVWNLASRQCLYTLTGHTQVVGCVDISTNGKFAASSSGDRTVRIWDIQNGKNLKVFQGHESYVCNVCFTPDGKSVLSCSGDKTVAIWNLEGCELHQTLQGHTAHLCAVSLSPDGKLVVTGSRDESVRIWNCENGRTIATLSGHSDDVLSAIFGYDGKLIATGSRDKSARVWDVSTGQCLRTLQGHTDEVKSVAFSHDNGKLATGSRDATIRIWDVQSGQCLQVLQGHERKVSALAFSEDDSRLVSGSLEHAVRVWDWQIGRCTHTFIGHENWIRSVSFTKDGKKVVSSARDKTTRIWDMDTAQMVRILPDEIDSRPIAEEQSFYALTRDLETVIFAKTGQPTDQPIAFFAEEIEEVRVAEPNLVAGRSKGTYLYLLELIGIGSGRL